MSSVEYAEGYPPSLPCRIYDYYRRNRGAIFGIGFIAVAFLAVALSGIIQTSAPTSGRSMQVPIHGTYWSLCEQLHPNSDVRECVWNATRIPGNPPAGNLRIGQTVLIP